MKFFQINSDFIRRRRPDFELLESRQFLSATQIDYADFSNTAGLIASGEATAALTAGTSLSLTDGAANENRGVFFDQRVPIDSFTEYFAYHATDATANGGSGFAIIFNGAAEDGAATDSAPGANSLAIEFNFTDPASASGTAYSIVEGGASGPSTLVSNSTVNLHDGKIWYVAVTYDGSQLTCALNSDDTDDGTPHYDRFTVPIDLESVLGSHSAYAGFTASTSDVDLPTQAIDTWTFSGSSTFPTVTGDPTTSSADNVVAGSGTTLSVNAIGSENDALTYDWSVMSGPTGAATPSFSVNDSASAATPHVSFSQDGTYHLAVTVLDSDGDAATSDVNVVVQQVATSLRLSPHGASIHRGKHQQYSVTVLDQFGHAMRDQGNARWSIQNGSGSIHSNGLFTAGKKGHFIVGVSVDDLTGTVAGAVS